MQINFLLSLAIEHKLPAMKTSLFGCDVCERFFNRSNDDGNETKRLRKKLLNHHFRTKPAREATSSALFLSFCLLRFDREIEIYFARYNLL